MLKYMNLRIIRLQFVIAFLILTSISMLHLYEAYRSYGTFGLLENTPYTQSLLFDSFSGVPLIYLLIMPLAVSVGVSDIYIQDRKQNLLHYAYMYQLRKNVDLKVILYSSVVAALLVITPLIMNFIGEFLILPNILPERFTNKPLGFFTTYTLNASLYYAMPILYILLYILLVGMWAATMNVLSITLSLYTNKRIYAIIGSFIFQIILIILTNFTDEPYIAPPIYFLLGKTGFMYINVLPILLTFILYVSLSIYFYIRGMRKYELD
ncbi:hypothetical protein [Mammaliicoccus sciuri]|uniref:hypothetical protein n=1 Tax=Mammaliicoccus sciuri TaxID=1296 RepID=UPI001AB0125C|nr:hypothetical protein [Mammaliicoccus sciuri]MBO3079529.1 hypothetical protein [Mammaliicoccus sciuri]MCO4324508.1 hypothetical protein [Mammaliicoccus sciuri]